MTPANRASLMIVLESEEADIYKSSVGPLQYVRPIAGDNEVVLVFSRVNAARMLRAWADRMEALP